MIDQKDDMIGVEIDAVGFVRAHIYIQGYP